MNWKIWVGLALMAPTFILGAYQWNWAFDNPALTRTQIFMVWWPYDMVATLLFFAGFIFFFNGKEEYEDD